MEKTYIFGHKRPDTDATMSALALSYLKNQLGDNTEARVLGDINKETQFALDYFKLKKPEYLNDVKLQIKDVEYHKKLYIEDTKTIYEAYQTMLKEEVTGLPIVTAKKELLGLVTLKDLSRNLIDSDIEDLYTTYDNIVKILKAESITKFNDEIIGNLYVAAYKSTRIRETFKFENNMILIVGDRHSVIEKAIESGVKMIVLSGNSEIHDEHIKLAKKNKVNVIRTELDSYHVTRLIVLSNYIKTLIKTFNPVKFEDTDFITDVKEVNEKDKHSNYPIVDKKNKCLGLLRITDISRKNPKKVILTDHNEKLQTAEGIDEAIILEIVDHHAIGTVTTAQPINFRNMAVGSSCTIVYTMFKERNMKIPKEIAGALLSGILSDTLILKSPTKTDIDAAAVEDLAKLAGVNYEDYGLELLKAGTSLEGMSKEDVLFNDYKLFKAGDKQFSIGQFITMNFEEIEKEMNDYLDVLDKTANNNDFVITCLYITDIIKNGSYVLYSRNGKHIMELAYGDKVDEGYFVEGCVSRKKNMVPVIMGAIE